MLVHFAPTIVPKDQEKYCAEKVVTGKKKRGDERTMLEYPFRSCQCFPAHEKGVVDENVAEHARTSVF